MNQDQLTVRNLGDSLDSLMNLDPRGYGVCKILYSAAREYTQAPLSTSFAENLLKTVKKDDLVFIQTGFVLLPFKKAEMDGIVSSVLLAGALIKAIGAKPVLICPEDNMIAAEKLAYVAGIHFWKTIEEVRKYPLSMAAIPFTKDRNEAKKQAEALAKEKPAAVIAIEAPGSNEKGVYHNATGLDLSNLEAKSDVLFELLASQGVETFAVGDLGNETGMGTVKETVCRYIPYAGKDGEGDSCRCGCGGGICAKTEAKHILTATVSDWGVYAVIAALAYFKNDLEIMHTPETERRALYTASEAGMIDMYGDLIPAIDGMNEEMNCSIVSLMRELVRSTLKLPETCKEWFLRVERLGYFDEH